MSYEEQRRILVEYLKMKVEQQDWHGVADAAMDLRELEARNVKKQCTCNTAASVPA